MSKIGMHSLLTLVALLVVLLTLVACGTETTPSGDTATTGASSPKSSPASTGAAQAQDNSRISLDDYLAICAGPTSGPIDEEMTLAGFATVLGEFTEQLEAAEPPEEVADWHDAVLVYQRALKEALDDAPGTRRG